MKKRLISIVMALLITLSLATSAFAVEDPNRIITAEEFYTVIAKEYAKYNVIIEVVDYNKNFVYTQSLLDSELARINSILNKGQSSMHIASGEESTGIIARSMIVEKVWKSHDRIENRGGYCDVETHVNATQDLQNGRWISIDSVFGIHNGRSSNLVSVDVYTYDLDISYDGKTISGFVQYKLVTEYTGAFGDIIKYQTFPKINVNWSAY